MSEREQIASYVETRAEWEPCDCGCPSRRRPKTLVDVELLRVAAAIRMGKDALCGNDAASLLHSHKTKEQDK